MTAGRVEAVAFIDAEGRLWDASVAHHSDMTRPLYDTAAVCALMRQMVPTTDDSRLDGHSEWNACRAVTLANIARWEAEGERRG